MSARLFIPPKARRVFFGRLEQVSRRTIKELAALVHVSPRTVRAWRRGDTSMPLDIVKRLTRQFHIRMPQGVKREQYWSLKKYAKQGGLAYYRLYGAPGDIESRRLAGAISQARRRANPDFYRKLGCAVRKSIPRIRHSVLLAEFCGIVLGDGGVTDSQIRITLNRKSDRKYALYVVSIMRRLFGETPSIIPRQNVINITLSSVSYVELLERLGIKRGNKVYHQVGVPRWILHDKAYARACLRGLMDTDGCFYLHRHMSGGRPYVHCGVTFTNHAYPLVEGVVRILLNFGFQPHRPTETQVYLYNRKAVIRFFRVIGTSNPLRVERFKAYLKKYTK